MPNALAQTPWRLRLQRLVAVLSWENSRYFKIQSVQWPVIRTANYQLESRGLSPPRPIPAKRKKLSYLPQAVVFC